MKPIRILIADDHALIRAGIRLLVENLKDIQVVGEASDGREAVELAKTHNPDIVLTDIAMPKLNGLGVLEHLKKQSPSLRIIVLSMHTNEEYVREALAAGAKGYIVKGADPAELEIALKAVRRGEIFLSPAVSRSVIRQFLDQMDFGPHNTRLLTSRQREILQMIAEGHTTKHIAQTLNLSIKTIESHRTELMNRLDIHDIAGLVRYAIRSGVISLET